MNRIICPLLAVVLLVTSGRSDEQPFPDTLAGFLEPGRYVAVHERPETDHIAIRILSKQAFEIATDIRDENLDIDKLIERHPAVAELRTEAEDRFLALVKSRLADNFKEIDEIEAVASVRRHNSHFRLGKVIHVGDDYFIVATGADLSDRHVYATRMIGYLSWHDGVDFDLHYRRK